ncbi:MAG: glycosyltransferase family 4 protein [Bacteroidia bacterium]|nr:glycosyltransferase family 4 protein [Bacteroidia bacterium]
MNIQSTLLVIGYVWPEPNSSAAGKRMMQLLQAFSRICERIVFASSAKKSGFEIDLSAYQIEEQVIKLNHDSFDDFVNQLQPNFVLYDRFYMEEQYAWRVRKYCPNSVQILDTEDLHFLRLARELAYKAKREVLRSDLQSDYAKREVASILRCDCSLIISEFEMKLLQTEFSIDSSILWYYPLFETYSSEPISSFDERENFVFIGNFWHEPNWQTLRFLKQEIWPALHKLLPKAELHVYGAYPSEKVFQLHNVKQGFLVKGRATDAKLVVSQAKVLLAPIVYGAGLKGKFLEAMSVATPSITSAIGAEGIANAEEWPGVLANTNEDIITAAHLLYTNKSVWETAQNKAQHVLQTRFKQSLFLDDFLTHIIYLSTNFEKHREANFMGSILRHHTLASSEYMSKWIELKSKV